MENTTISAPTELNSDFNNIQNHIKQNIVGQEKLTKRLLIALLVGGHVLIEGAPGLAKTKLIKHLGEIIACSFHRVQFTPDLLPADITGTDIFNSQENTFSFRPGPIFHNLVLADEINRAPAKVQSALLEAMAEKQITVGASTYQLPELFMVLATQNPIEQEGTHRLPEAQLDRFLLYCKINNPNAQDERKILDLSQAPGFEKPYLGKKIKQEHIFQAQAAIKKIHVEAIIMDYIVEIVMATRIIKTYDEKLVKYIDAGSSPRGSIALLNCAKAYAWLDDRDYITPADVQEMAAETLAHRILLSFYAEAEGVTGEKIISKILSLVGSP